MMPTVTILQGDCLDKLKELSDASVHCCVTSPPYWGLRDYGVDGQLGLEKTPQEYVEKMVAVFGEVRRVLRDDGTLWLNLGDSYAGNAAAGDKVFGNSEFNSNRPSRVETKTASKQVPFGLKPKDLVGIPWRVAFALQSDGWYLRSDIIWSKPNPMPESVTDRPTKAHEYIFLLSKSQRYYYDAESIKEKSVDPDGSAARYEKPFTGANGRTICPNDKDGQRYRPEGMREFDGTRNRRTVWEVATAPYPEAHFATYPPDLIKPCILAGCPVGGTVLDPFGGSGTTGMVALELGRNAILIELNPKYVELMQQRTSVTPGML